MICSYKGCNIPLKEIVRTYTNSKGIETTSRWSFSTCTLHRPTRKLPVGTERRTVDGYILVKTIDGWRNQHSLVMEQKLGRKLAKGESVHHIDGDRQNNAPDNLELWVGNVRYGQRAADIKCPHCHKAYLELV